MLCSHCNKKEANFHYKQVNNGKYTELNLCSDCARELGYLKDDFGFNFNDSFGFGNLLGDFLNMSKPAMMGAQSLSCKKCGTSYNDFMHGGLLGCEDCYDVFKQAVEGILNDIQPSSTHIGKIGGKKGEKITRKNELDSLKEDLKRAVIDERYEDAAKIRDKIKKCEKENEKEDEKENKKDDKNGDE